MKTARWWPWDLPSGGHQYSRATAVDSRFGQVNAGQHEGPPNRRFRSPVPSQPWVAAEDSMETVYAGFGSKGDLLAQILPSATGSAAVR